MGFEDSGKERTPDAKGPVSAGLSNDGQIAGSMEESEFPSTAALNLKLNQEWQALAAGAVPLQRRVDPNTLGIGFAELPSKPEDPEKPTFFVLDDFRRPVVTIQGKHGFSHGELSARMAEENGLNVRRFQIDVMDNGVVEDIAKSLKHMVELIDDGKLKVKPGDVLNLSFAIVSTYPFASGSLGMDLSPENIKEKREEILAAINKAKDDPSLLSEIRAFFSEVSDINNSIKDLQERGLKVISAAGNNGPGRFNIGLLAADKQYSALNSDGTLADYSGKNSFTEDGRGQVDFYYQLVDLIDPRGIANQSGYYHVDGTGIKLPAAEFGGLRFDTKRRMSPESIQKLNLDLATDMRFSRAQEFDYRSLREFPSDLQAAKSLNDGYGIGSFIKDLTQDGYSLFDSGPKLTVNPFAPIRLLQGRTESVDYSQWRKGSLAVTARGTSFVNVFEAKQEF